MVVGRNPEGGAAEMKRAAFPLLVIGLVLAAVFGISVGSEALPFRHIVELLLSSAAREMDPIGTQIILGLRLPRVLAAALTGASLSVAGAALQALLQNPLADPYVLGVSAGASVGAALVIVLGAGLALAGFAVPLAALVGALMATLLVFGLARTGGRLPGLTLLLAGVVVGSVLSSMVTILLFLAGSSDKMQPILLWTMGGFGDAEWSRVAALAPVSVLGTCVLWAMGRDLNLLAFGEDPARFLGVDVESLKRGVLFLAAVLTACAVAVGGVIGFVGLIVPHAVRRVLGPDHRRLIPAVFLAGAAFLILADVAARTLHPPTELPVGLLTGLLGGPFFLVLLRSQRIGK